MLRTFLACFGAICVIAAHAQFKNDNVTYRNVFPEDLCKTLQANPGFILLDVRSQGEFDDTLASSPGLNIGRLKGSLHISIAELPQRWKELLAYKDKPLFIYCSHSQRSRRATRMLADSGFTKLFNVDGGLTDFYVQGIAQNKCNNYTVETLLPYTIMSPKQLDESIRNRNEYFIIDLRSDSSFKGISLSESINAMGYFKDATNIPFTKFKEAADSINSDRPVLLVDDYGSESPVAAKMLTDRGMKGVSILLNGMDEWLDYSTSKKNKTLVKWASATNYKIIPAEEFYSLLEKKRYSIFDLRSKEEFSNNSKNYWENIGQIKTAVNVPADDIIAGAELPVSKTTAVVLYGFNNGDKIYKVAAKLKKDGYQNISVLRSGIWNLRWSSHNISGRQNLNSLVVNVPEQNL